MIAIINFVFYILSALIGLLIWAIIINAILSWLVAFDVINADRAAAAPDSLGSAGLRRR